MKLDIIGDIHGCYDELIALIQRLGYSFADNIPVHPEGRNLAFVGDATDRGPQSIAVLELLFAMQDRKMLNYSPGNHCNKLYRYAKGNPVKVAHGLETTVAELQQMPSNKRRKFLERYRQFYEALPPYQALDRGQLIIAHAGLLEHMVNQPISKKIVDFVLYGDVSGITLPNGRPARGDWAKTYKGTPFIVYGHTPVLEPRWKNNTVNIDTGCVFGGHLTAVRYPELEIVSVPSLQPFAEDRFTKFYD